MHRIVSRLALVAALTFAVGAVVAPGAAWAQKRDFTGKVDKVTNSAIYVDNRKGDKLKFAKTDETAVSGQKATWDEIKKNDWVTVNSNMFEKPRKAYSVTVVPNPEADE
jgi:hypothetical protein